MNNIWFVEGVPGVGKTTFVHSFLREHSKESCPYLIPSDDIIPINPVRREILKGRLLSIEEAREVYASKPYQVYLEEHLDIWNRFCAEKSDLHNDIVVDAGLIQAPLYELVGLYMLKNEDILRHIKCVLEVIKETFLPELIYLRAEEPQLCIRTAIEEQKPQREQWIAGFLRWLDIAPYSLKMGYAGLSGIEQFVSDRYNIDNYLLERLDIPIKIYTREML